MLGALALAGLALALLADDQIADVVEPPPRADRRRHRRRGRPARRGAALVISRRPEVLPLADRRRPALPRPGHRRRGDREPAAAALRRHRRRLPGLPPRAGRDPDATPKHWRVTRLRRALRSCSCSTRSRRCTRRDTEHAVKNLCFFYIPFALLFRLLLDVEWTPRLLHDGVRRSSPGSRSLFAAVGFFEYATGRLLITNSKLLEANDVKPYFRVNSVFFDPNIYGRYLALTMTGLAAALLWTRRRKEAAYIAVALAILWGGPAARLSQSSFAALLIGLAVLAALRWRARPVLIAVVTAAGRLGGGRSPSPARRSACRTESEASVNRATSGRVDLVEGALDMIRDRPDPGLRLGRVRRASTASATGIRSKRTAAVSHTTPLTDRRRAGADRPGRLRSTSSGRRWRCSSPACAPRSAAARPGVPAVARAALAAGVLRPDRAHVRLRGVPRGPARLDRPGGGGRGAPGGARTGAGRRAGGGRRKTSPRPRPGLSAGRLAHTLAGVLPRRRRTRVLLAVALVRPARRSGRRGPRLPRRDRRAGQRPQPRCRVRRGRRRRAEPVPLDRSQWPLYGYTKDHRRIYLPKRKLPIRGPWDMVWRYRAIALLEFPPVIYRGSIYQLADDGVLFSAAQEHGAAALEEGPRPPRRPPRRRSAAAASTRRSSSGAAG